jgi:isopenicillin-N epimerase
MEQHGGWRDVMRRNHALALLGRDVLCDALGIAPPAPDEMLGAMAAVPLPDGMPYPAAIVPADPLQDKLLFTYNIEVPITPWPEAPKRVLRVSAQLYNERADYEKLAAALRAEL